MVALSNGIVRHPAGRRAVPSPVGLLMRGRNANRQALEGISKGKKLEIDKRRVRQTSGTGPCDPVWYSRLK